MKKIAISLGIIGVVAAIVIGATTAYFSDTETSKGNTLTAGIIDIVVDDENPWTKTYSQYLEDMKPCETRYIEFTVRNIPDSNPVNVWKHIDITDQNDGYITEPECTEGGGTWIGGATPCTNPTMCCIDNYTPRNNLAAYTIYDLYVDGRPIIEENQYVRLDNISSAWIYLGTLEPGETITVKQSYHLRSWPDAPEPEVTNWAQGDEMTFNIDLMATQLNAPGPKGAIASLTLDNKDPVTWIPIVDGFSGTLTYNTSGSTFDYNFSGVVPQPNTSYCLVYYADPWPGDGKNHLTGMDIECAMSGASGNLSLNGNVELNSHLPNSDDQNYPGGAKLQIVLDADYDNTNDKMTAWNPTQYLFEMQFITYDDTDL